MNREEIQEKAAKAAFEAFGWNVETHLSWDEAPEEFRITFNKIAMAVLEVVDEYYILY